MNRQNLNSQPKGSTVHINQNQATEYGRRQARVIAQQRANDVGHRVYLQSNVDGPGFVVADDGRGPLWRGTPWTEFRPDWFHYRGRTLDMIRHANRAAGFHFFDADTLRFFQSRVSDTLYGGRFFVTSECPPFGTRAWTVREAHPDGSIGTVGDFMEHATRAAAHRAARAAAAASEAAAR